MKTRYPILGLLALALIVTVAGEAYASCTGSDRVDRDDAGCLSGWWDNNSWPSKSTFGAQNLCPAWGTVVAKVDIKNASDRTWHLANGNKRRGSTSHSVRDIYCCKDLSGLCDKSDVLTEAGCRAQFENSSVNGVSSCWLQSGTAGVDVDVDDEECTFWAICRRDNGSEAAQTITVSWPNADDLVNCNGDLRLSSC